MVLFLMAFLGVRHERQRAAPKPEENPAAAAVIVEVGFERLARVKKFPAVIEPWIAADVRSSVEGRVVDKFVESEAEVKKGDPLLRLEETHARSENHRTPSGTNENVGRTATAIAAERQRKQLLPN